MNKGSLEGTGSGDEPEGAHLAPKTTISLKPTLVVWRLKKNMRYEFLGVIAVFVLLTYFTFALFGSQNPQITFLSNVLSISLITLITISVFYYLRFYIFYRSISIYDLNVEDSIRRLGHELELNIEIHKAYNFCIVPLAILIAIEIKGGASGTDYIRHFLASDFFNSPWHLLCVFLTIISLLTIAYFGANWYTSYYYGKALAEIRYIADERAADCPATCKKIIVTV